MTNNNNFYKHFDIKGNEVNLHNTEDKNWWLLYGNKKEEAFIKFAEEKGILPGIQLNPERPMKPWLPEFIYEGKYADLKEQTTPFFTAKKYNVPPRYAFTLNVRDVNDIAEKYSGCQLIIYINWLAVRFQMFSGGQIINEISVVPLQGVWLLKPIDLEIFLTNSPIHSYKRRFNDTRGNAKDSYVIDVRKLNLIWKNPEHQI